MARSFFQLRAGTPLLVLAVIISCTSYVVSGYGVAPKKLEFYLHEVTAPGPEATDILTALPTGNASYYSFGNMGVSEHVIREGVCNTSKVIGRAPGLFQPNKEYPTFALQKLLTVDTGSYSGTLVVFSDWNYVADSNEWAVVGGTQSFRMARGYATNRIVEGGQTADYSVYKWEIFLV